MDLQAHLQRYVVLASLHGDRRRNEQGVSNHLTPANVSGDNMRMATTLHTCMRENRNRAKVGALDTAQCKARKGHVF